MVVLKPRKQPVPWESITLYTTGLCNLACSYCYICKANKQALKEIDQHIEQEFNTGNFIKRIEEEFSERDRKNIQELDLWGGETLIGLDRVTNSLEEFIRVLPNYHRSTFSTNLTLPTSIDIIDRLMQKMSKLMTRGEIWLQVSIDGPEELNDASRGFGVTTQILENYNKLLKLEVPDNIVIHVSTKPTLSMESLDYLNSISRITDYYEFFAEYLSKPFKTIKPRNITLFLGIPNFQEPFQYTQESSIKIGELFRNFQKVSRNCSKEIKDAFGDVSLVPYVARMFRNGISRKLNSSECDAIRGGGCGKMSHCITLTPEGLYSLCHRGYFDENDKYTRDTVMQPDGSNMSPKTWNWAKPKADQMREIVNEIYEYPHKMRVLDVELLLYVYAKSGIADAKYLDRKECRKAAKMMEMQSCCYQSNLERTGSIFVQDDTYARLFCNGAADVIIEELEYYDTRRR